MEWMVAPEDENIAKVMIRALVITFPFALALIGWCVGVVYHPWLFGLPAVFAVIAAIIWAVS